MPEGEIGGACTAQRNARIMGNALAWPDRKLQPSLQVKEGYGSVFKLLADNAFCLEAKAIAIEPKRPLQVVNANGNNGDSRLHDGFLIEA